MTRTERELVIALIDMYRAGNERGYHAQRYFEVLWKERGTAVDAVR